MTELAERIFEAMLYRQRDKLWLTSVIEAAMDVGVVEGVRDNGDIIVSSKLLLDDIYREFLRNATKRYVTLSGNMPYQGEDT